MCGFFLTSEWKERFVLRKIWKSRVELCQKGLEFQPPETSLYSSSMGEGTI